MTSDAMPRSTDKARAGRVVSAALVAAAVLACAGAAAAAEVRGRDLGTHAELVFQWDEAAAYRIRRNGDRILVDFDRQVGDGAARAFRRVGSYLEDGRVIGDGSTILMVLEPSVVLLERSDGAAITFELRPPPAEPEPTVAAVHASPRPAAARDPVLDLSPDLQAPPTAQLPLPASEAAAAPQPSVRVRGGEHPAYSRIVFDWPDSVGYRVARTGGRVDIAFDVAAVADFARAAPDNLSRVDALRQAAGGDGGLVVSLAVPPDSGLRHFRLGAKVVIDILDRGETPASAQPEAPPPSPVQAEAPVAAPPAIAERRPEARVPHASQDGDLDHSGPAPAPAAAEGAAAPVPASGIDEAADAREAGPPLSLRPQRPAARRPVTVEAVPALPPDPVARFDPGVPSALAVFERGRALWVVFASESPLDASALAAQGSPALGTVDVIRAEGGIALRFQPRDDGEVVVTRSGTRWTVALERAAIRPAETLTVVPQPDYPLGPRLLLAGGFGPGLVRLTDPLVGDVLIVAPVSQPAIGLPRGARFAQVRLLPSVQGAVARPMSESLAMRIARDGVEITDVDGLLLSASADTAREVVAIAPPADVEDRLLEVESWRGSEGEGFIARRQAVQRALALAPEADRDRARLDFARFNFAHGYAEEALGLMALVERSQPSIAGREGFAILRGAALVLADDLDAALRDLNHPGLAETRDAALWRATFAEHLGVRVERVNARDGRVRGGGADDRNLSEALRRPDAAAGRPHRHRDR